MKYLFSKNNIFIYVLRIILLYLKLPYDFIIFILYIIFPEFTIKNIFKTKYKKITDFENISIKNNKNKIILFIDQKVPFFDKDAGSRSVFHYISFFSSNNYNVKYIGDDFIKHEPYTSIIENSGIEVLYGPYFRFRIKYWIKKHSNNIDYIILNKPITSFKYMNIVKNYTKAKVFYFGHDLHYLRFLREYEIKKKLSFLFLSKIFKYIEYSIMKKVDMTYYFSTIEIEKVKNINNEIKCKVIPINIFPKKEYQIFNNSRKGLLFVGGFNHSPNIDAVIWFINEIFDIIVKSIPDIIFYIIGSNAPDKIKNIKNNYINYIGYIEDDILLEYYKNCRISVIPLRYGAGVKGKVIEALYNQIPVITTSIGAEGLPDIENNLIIENDPNKFALNIINMYNDYEYLNNLSEKGLKYILNNFTSDKIIEIINQDF